MDVRPGYKRTDVGIIPKDWHEVLLDHVAKRGSGHTPDKKHPEYWNGNIKWISLADSSALDQVFIDDTISYITPEGLAHSSAVLHPPGTVVLSRDAGIGKSAIMRTEMAVSQHFMAWRCGPDLDNKFLYYWLQAAKPQFERIANGTTIKTIGLQYFKDLKLPVPPHREQCAIAAAVSDVDALVHGLDGLIAKKRDLKQAAMQQLLTGKTRLPGFQGEWEAKRLGETGTFLKGSGVKKDEANSGDLPCIRYGEIYTHHNDYIKSFNSWISSRVAATATRLRQGDLLFAGSGETKEEIGKCVAFVDDREAFAGGDIVILRLADANPMFMGYYCNTAPINAQKASKGQGDAVVHISATALSSIEVTLPSYDEQTAVVAVLSDMDIDLSALEARRDKVRALKQGMMQELLTGKTRLVAAGGADA
jgi:type I restriction enzyme S subunit